MNETSNKLYFGGIPTEPDVRKLMESYPVDGMKPGDLIGYEEIGTVIMEKVRSSRWKSVTTAWRKKLEDESKILLKCISDKMAFKVLNDDEKADERNKKQVEAGRKARKSLKIHLIIDKQGLSDKNKAEYDFYEQRAKGIIAAAQLRKPRLEPPTLKNDN